MLTYLAIISVSIYANRHLYINVEYVIIHIIIPNNLKYGLI